MLHFVDETFQWWAVTAILFCIKDLNLLEFLLLWLGWRYRDRIFTKPRLEKANVSWQWLAARPALSCVVVGCLPILLRLALLPVLPVPQPMIVDEFSHLLVADTFMHGRLTNPTHPLWTHFESVHIIQHPTYNSMYFPAQGLALFAGALMGLPWLGILLATGAMCGAIVWALQPFMPNRWAILAGLLAVLRFGLLSYWVNTYWGGSLAALGGALVLGAYGRLRRKPSIGLGLTLGVGLTVIGIVRPLEGLAFALPFALLLLRRFSFRALVPAALVLGIAFAGLGVYFQTVTGNRFTPGYVLNEKEYGWPLVLPGQKPTEPRFRHKELQQYYEWEKGELEKKNSLAATATFAPWRVIMGWTFFIGPALSIGLLHLKRVLANRRLRIIVVSAAACALPVFLEAGYPHYLAPAAACLMAIAVQGLRYARASRIAPIRGRVAVPLAFSVLSLLIGVHVIAAPLKIPYLGAQNNFHSWCCVTTDGILRKKVETTVAAQPGMHVILIRYHHKEFKGIEWVYNGADIDGARIVWARDMGAARNEELVRYYPSRRFWIVDADDVPAVVRPYGGASTVGESASR